MIGETYFLEDTMHQIRMDFVNLNDEKHLDNVIKLCYSDEKFSSEKN